MGITIIALKKEIVNHSFSKEYGFIALYKPPELIVLYFETMKKIKELEERKSCKMSC